MRQEPERDNWTYQAGDKGEQAGAFFRIHHTISASAYWTVCMHKMQT